MMSAYFKFSIFIVICCASQSYAFDKLSLDERSGLFVASEQTVSLVSARYVGWEADWKWAGPELKRDKNSEKNKSVFAYTGISKKLDLGFNAQAKSEPGQIEWDYSWEKSAVHPNAIGMGIEFVLTTHSPTFNKPPQLPELLPGNKGWRWQTPDGNSIEVTFSPALDKLYFERNQKNRIRAFFFSSIDKGEEKTSMKVSFSKNIALDGLASSKYDNNDRQEWQRDILSEKASPVDLSFLNKNELPAGKHGFIRANADKLVFEDGAPVRFWGANLMGNALFTTSEVDIKPQASRIAQLGFNLIRIHHHDSSWVKPNIFKNQDDNTQELSPDAFKKLDRWIKCLKDEGVYIWLDLHVGRKVTKNDGIEHFDDMVKGKPAEIKGFNYFNASVQQQMQKFNEAYLNHVNPYTKLAYKSDPAVIALLLTNENDLTQHFGNLFLPDKGHPKHNALFKEDTRHFSEVTGLPGDKVWRTWEMGEGKIYLSEVEHRFNQKMISHLRNLGAKSMVATTNSWGGMGLFGLPSLTDGNIIDVHSYGRADEYMYNPRFNPGFLSWIGGSQVTGKPLSVTEWNVEPFPVVDRFTSAIYTASIANLQGWDAMMIYGYSQHQLGGKMKGTNYSTFNDPAITGLMPAAALLFRQGHVSGAKQHYELQLNNQEYFYKKQDPSTSKTIRTLMETSRVTVAMPEVKSLPWLKNSQDSEKAVVINDANKDFIPEGQKFVQSDTGELKRDWDKGIHTINTSQSQVASGWIGGQEIKLADVSLNIDTKKAVVAVQSLDKDPIRRSKNIFLTIMARSSPEKDGFLSEPVTGELLITAPSGLKLHPINSIGNKMPALPTVYAKGRYHINLEKKNAVHWFILSAT